MNPVLEPPKRHRTFAKLVFVILCLAALTLLVFLWPTAAPRDQLLWLTPAEFARVRHVGPLTRLKYSVMNWTAPLWKGYWQNRPRITIKASALNLSPATPWPTNFVPPCVIATNGTRACILSATQIKELQTQVKALPGAAVLARPQIVTVGGGAAQMSMGNSFGTGSNPVFAGFNLFVMPSTTSDKISLTIGLIHTEAQTNRASGVVGVKTNQAYACRAVLPNDGGLLLENPTPEPGSSNRFWLLLSASAVDANGRLLGR